jgi:hypothetical protein
MLFPPASQFFHGLCTGGLPNLGHEAPIQLALNDIGQMGALLAFVENGTVQLVVVCT